MIKWDGLPQLPPSFLMHSWALLETCPLQELVKMRYWGARPTVNWTHTSEALLLAFKHMNKVWKYKMKPLHWWLAKKQQWVQEEMRPCASTSVAVLGSAVLYVVDGGLQSSTLPHSLTSSLPILNLWSPCLTYDRNVHAWHMQATWWGGQLPYHWYWWASGWWNHRQYTCRWNDTAHRCALLWHGSLGSMQAGQPPCCQYARGWAGKCPHGVLIVSIGARQAPLMP